MDEEAIHVHQRTFQGGYSSVMVMEGQNHHKGGLSHLEMKLGLLCQVNMVSIMVLFCELMVLRASGIIYIDRILLSLMVLKINSTDKGQLGPKLLNFTIMED
jgi:hypothetical protein